MTNAADWLPLPARSWATCGPTATVTAPLASGVSVARYALGDAVVKAVTRPLLIWRSACSNPTTGSEKVIVTANSVRPTSAAGPAIVTVGRFRSAARTRGVAGRLPLPARSSATSAPTAAAPPGPLRWLPA